MNNLGYSHIFKVVFSGPANVGKTCLCNRFFTNTFDEETKSTIGVDFRAKDVVVDGKDVKLQIWDTAGQERFRGLSSLYYRGAHGIIFVFDISKSSSLVEVAKMMDELPPNTKETTAFLLLGNKSDLHDTREVMPEVAQELAQKRGCNYVEVSAKTGAFVNEAIMSLITGKLEFAALTEQKRELSAGTKDLPLTDVNVKCELRGLVASVVISQRYENKSENPLELTLGFPIDELGSVCKFEATKDTGEKIVGKVLPKKQAAEKYDDAIAEGKSAVLLEEKPGGIFIASVGMLGPKRHIIVETTYVTELLVIRGNVFQFTYKTLFDKQKRSEYINEAKLQEVSPNYSIQVDVYAPSRIVNLKCTSHDIQTEMQEDEKHVIVKADSGLPEANFVLRFSVQDPYTPSAWLEHNPVTDTTAVMIPFLPDMEAGIDAEKTEFIFVVDRSGSMAGSPWEACAAALQVFLRSIPPGCYFQIIGFGTHYETVFDESRQYMDTNLSFASSVISSWSASLGGTEMLEPLKFVYSSVAPPQIIHRRVVILTDGAVGNREAVVALVRKNSENFETSCMGIGSGVDEKLVRDVAAAGGGSEEFSRNVGDLEVKVIRQLKRAMSREMKNIKVNWGELPVGNLAASNDGTDLHVFMGEKLVLYAILDEKQPEKDKKYSITVTGTTYQKETVHEITLDTTNTTTGFYVHALAARNFIRSIVNSPQYYAKEPREKIVALSVKYSVSSPLASFVAVEETTSGEATEGTLQKVDMVAKTDPASPVLHNTKGMLQRASSSMAVGDALSRLPTSVSVALGPKELQQSSGAAPCCSGFSLFSSTSSSPTVTTTTSTQRSPSQAQETISTRRRASSTAHKPPTMTKLTLANVVYLQRAEGQWALDTNLAAILGSSIVEVQKGISSFPAEMSPSAVFSDKTLIDTLWATALALAILETKYPKDQEKWTLLSTKAYCWMDKIFENSKVKIFSSEDWVGFAKKWLETL